MRQEFLMLADGAEAVAGKVYILGGGADMHAASNFPAALKADIALGFLVAWSETNQPIQLQVRVVDADEQEVLVVAAEVVVGRPPSSKPGQDIRNMVAIKGPFPIERPGAYKLVMRLDGADQEPPFRFWVDRSAVSVHG